MTDKIEIELSKSKIFLFLVAAIGFVVFGVILFLYPDKFVTSEYRNPSIIKIVGIISAVFFGICTFIITKKLFDTTFGIVIDENGIIDNSNATSIGLVEWADITGVKTTQVTTTKFLIIETNNPEKYIEKAKNGFSKSAMKANNKMYGSPISITTNSLNIKHQELEKILKNELEKRRI